MTIYLYETTDLNGSSYPKIPLGSSAVLSYENDDRFCFSWSILAYVHLCYY